MSGNVVRLIPRPRVSRSKQTGPMNTSIEMANMLGDIAGMEESGGCLVMGLNRRTMDAIWRRGLVAQYECHGSRLCLSPVGRNVLRYWRFKKGTDQ